MTGPPAVCSRKSAYDDIERNLPLPLYSVVLKNVTVEPTIILYYLSLSISNFVGNNLLLRKSCDPDGLIGDDLTVACPYEKLAQRRVTAINSWKIPTMIFLSTVVVLITGIWTDRSPPNRRYVLLVLPIVGHVLTDLACCLNVYFWTWKPELLGVFESILPGLTGHRHSVWIGAMCYVSEHSSERYRTLRIGLLNAVYYIFSPIGSGLAGTINVRFGFMNTFLISAGLNVVGLICAYYLIVKDRTTTGSSTISSSRIRSDVLNSNDKKIARENLFVELIKSYRVFFKPRNGYRRSNLLLMILISPLSISRFVGESAVLYLFVRYKFGWNEVDYSIFTAYKMVAILIGTLFSIGLLSHYLKINDALIGIVGTTVDTIAALLYFMVNSSFQMYIIPLVDMFHGAALTLAASISTKCVESDELGKLNTMQAVLSALFPIIISPIYSQLYSLTFEKMPSVFFLISAVISIPTVGLFTVVYCFNKKQPTEIDSSSNEEQNRKNHFSSVTECEQSSSTA